MGTRELGQADPTGNYGMSQAEADKAGAWAKERAKRINADPTIPRRHRADAERRANLDSVTAAGRDESVTVERDAAERKKAQARARSKAYRKRKR